MAFEIYASQNNDISATFDCTHSIKQPTKRTLTLQYCSKFSLFLSLCLFVFLHFYFLDFFFGFQFSAVINALRNRFECIRNCSGTTHIHRHSHSHNKTLFVLLSIILWINKLRHWGISIKILQNAMRSFTPRI